MDGRIVAALEPAADISERTDALFKTRLASQRAGLDRMFAKLMPGLWGFAIFLSLVISPYSWEGKTPTVHLHVTLAVVGGMLLTVFPFLLARWRAGEVITRHVMAVNLTLWAAMYIHLTGGRIETHFFIFGCLAWLSFYLDWRVLLTATLAVVVDHVLRGTFYPESVYGIVNPQWWRFLEHGFWVIFEDVVLVWGCINGLRVLRESAEREGRLVELNEINENKSAALAVMLAELETAEKQASTVS